jgi:hypothetical protein
MDFSLRLDDNVREGQVADFFGCLREKVAYEHSFLCGKEQAYGRFQDGVKCLFRKRQRYYAEKIIK